MQKYVLTEQDIRVLIEVAGETVCEERKASFAESLRIMRLAADISVRILNHLSGKKEFPEESILISRIFDATIVERAPINEAATSGRTEK